MSYRQKTVCRFYNFENPLSCRYGDRCAFAHIQPSNLTVQISNPAPLDKSKPRRSGIDSKFKYVAPRLVQQGPSVANPTPQELNVKVSGDSRTISRKSIDSEEVVQSSKPEPNVAPSTSTKVKSQRLEAYSSLSDLTPSDLAAFERSRFVLGNVPILPPPKALC